MIEGIPNVPGSENMIEPEVIATIKNEKILITYHPEALNYLQ